MDKAKLIFSDKSELIVSTESEFFGIRFSKNEALYGDEESTKKIQFMFPKTASVISYLDLDLHVDAGILPAMVEVLENYPYFYLKNDETLIYSSKAVVKIELID
ncbi:hypothetical protein [Facklamia miroungae]|uniref:Uncharacterized protein n=1 Tax=Facklamia miroungae TaxID=120956 RepID=A0A1G7NXV8_9LACT|nr:hypothetical protein [Facklamia miroungae]NKZ28510.1 hypothetical protein [Facklamia miroungae]SDF78865.1 hypothetical protein SAMN05421791_10150 [Facklamia miroungae]